MSTDTHFRDNSSFIHDLLIAGGWTQTADTGQINFATVNKPGAGNTKAGYAIYEMADALQATVPLFLKINFGTGGTAATFGIWITLSTSTDGTGTPNGTVYVNNDSVSTPTCGSSASAPTGTVVSRGSADTSRVVCEMFDHDGTAAICLRFAIERSKSTIGADTGDGFIFMWSTSSSWNRQQNIPVSGGVPPTAENGIQMILSSNTPSAFGLNVGVGIPIPLLGFAQQPGIQLIGAKSGDFAAGTTLTFTLYGTSRTFQFGNNTTSQLTAGITAGVVSSARTAILFE